MKSKKCLTCDQKAFFACAVCEQEFYCSRKCQKICDRITSLEWSRSLSKKNPEVPSFRNWKGQNQMRLKIRDLKDPFVIDERIYSLKNLLLELARGNFSLSQFPRLGGEKGGEAFRVVYGTSNLPWKPSVVLKKSETRNAPMESSIAELSLIRLLSEQIFEERISPHVPIYYDHFVSEQHVIFATDYAHFGTFQTYMHNLGDANKRAEATDVFLFQIIYTMYVLQKKFPHIRHTDMHPGNIFVRAYDYEGVTQYTTEFGTTLIPNIGAQVIVADWDWGYIPGYIENAKTASFFVSNESLFEIGYNYERLPGMDMYRIISQLRPERFPGAKLLDIIRAYYKFHDFDLKHTTYAPVDMSTWMKLPTPADLLPLAIKYFNSFKTTELVGDSFSTLSIEPIDASEYQTPVYRPDMSVKSLPITSRNNFAMFPQSYLDSIFLSPSVTGNKLKQYDKEQLKEWLKKDVLTQNNDLFTKSVFMKINFFQKYFDLPPEYNILIVFAIYAQALLNSQLTGPGELGTIYLDLEEWNLEKWFNRLFDKVYDKDAAQQLIDEMLIAYYKILFGS